MGWLADRFSKKYVMLLIYLLVAVAIPVPVFWTTPISALCVRRVFGIGLGGDYMIIPLDDRGNLRGADAGQADGSDPDRGRHRGSPVTVADGTCATPAEAIPRAALCWSASLCWEPSPCWRLPEQRKRRMSANPFPRLGTVKNVAGFQEHLHSLGLTIPCDHELMSGSRISASPAPGQWRHQDRQSNRRCSPWRAGTGSLDGNPSENTFRRWQRFGRSGAKLIWGGEAVAVSHEGRANPNQLVIGRAYREGLAQLRATLIEEHRLTTGSDDGLLIGLQLTHSGRFCRPNAHDRPEPRILYHHPIPGSPVEICPQTFPC